MIRILTVHREANNQELSKKNPTLKEDHTRNEIAWHTAEKLLNDTLADVLVIFDCCNAGALCKYRSYLRFQYLAACKSEQVTPAPSEKSFTRALIWALEQLSKKSPFHLPKLLDMIGKAPNFPRTQQPEIGHRIDTSREDIYLAPIEKDDSCTNSTS